jgi:hypothetical protein
MATFRKRQKEIARLDKQRRKAERRAQRKLAKENNSLSKVDQATEHGAAPTSPVPSISTIGDSHD